MTFSEYWERLKKKNPQLETSERMTMSVESFRDQIERAYETGRQQGARADSIFGRIFG